MKTSLSKFNTLTVLASLTAALALTGCAGVKNSMRLSSKDSVWNPVAKLKAEKEKEAEPAEPMTMVATWKGSVLETAGVNSRGFGGRIFFYDAANNAVEAEGELTVYGFDDTKKKAGDSGADKKFVFRASEFQTHKSDNGLGASYSIWIPWEKVGGYRKTISLIPIFKTKDGKILKGGQAVNVLHGKTPQQQLSSNGPFKVLGSSPAVLGQGSYGAGSENDAGSENGSGVVSASFEAAAQLNNKIKTSTIKLTPNMARRVEAGRDSTPEKPKAKSLTTDQSLDELRKLLDERSAAAPANTKPTATEVSQTSTPRQPFGSPGSFK